MKVEYTIRPTRGWQQLDWREILDYRDLLLLLVRRDFLSKYKQTVLGPLWYFFQPLAMTVVYTLIFSRLAKIPTDELPPMLFYLCGLLGWNYFNQCFNNISATFHNHADLFGKVYFPRIIVPLAMLLTNLVAFAVQLFSFLLLFIYFKAFSPDADTFGISASIVFLPLVLLQTGILAIGVGLWITALTAKYRDLIHTLQFFTQVWLYATPVIYPLSEIPPNWQWVFYFNPVAPLVESFRIMFLGQGTLSAPLVLSSLAVTALVAVSGLLIFNKVQRTFIDTI